MGLLPIVGFTLYEANIGILVFLQYYFWYIGGYAPTPFCLGGECDCGMAMVGVHPQRGGGRESIKKCEDAYFQAGLQKNGERDDGAKQCFIEKGLSNFPLCIAVTSLFWELKLCNIPSVWIYNVHLVCFPFI